MELHWRNTEYLTKFMNDSGKIKNNYQTRLTRTEQRKLQKVIKHSRNMMLLPYVGYIRPTDRKSLTSLQDDMNEVIRRRINIESGYIYVDDATNKSNNNLEDPFLSEDPLKYSEEAQHKIKDLELEYIPQLPSEE
mmetsp:Transcript_727/g.680  ORF Transcript_727/g.680 Transcript_727/m.680 type:complete len:135 (+) Transcript_727:316-720(+)